MDYLASWISSRFMGPGLNPSENTVAASYNVDKDGYYTVGVCMKSGMKMYRLFGVTEEEASGLNGVWAGDMSSVFITTDGSNLKSLQDLFAKKGCLDISPCDDQVKDMCCPTRNARSSAMYVIFYAIAFLFLVVVLLAIATYRYGHFDSWRIDLFNAPHVHTSALRRRAHADHL